MTANGATDSRPGSAAGAAKRVDELISDAAARQPHRVALENEDGSRLSYAELAHLIAGVAADLEDRGLRAGDRIAVVFENSWSALVLLLAAMRVQAWPIALNARLSASELDAIFAHSDPRLVCFGLLDSKPAMEHAAARGLDRASAFSLPGFGLLDLPNAAPVEVYGETPGAAALLIYTSGSTGRPKGVMLSHANLAFIMTAGTAQGWFRPDDRIYAALPMSHSFGLVSVALSGLAAGAQLFPVARFSAAHAGALIRDGRVTAFLGVPTMYARLLEHCEAHGLTLRPNRLRLAYIGGAPTDPGHKASYETLLGINLCNGYGLTEAAPTVSRTLAEEATTDLAVGRPLPGIGLEIRDTSSGRPLPAGIVGTLFVRGPNVMHGYFRDPEGTAAAVDAQGWLDTGDLAQIGDDGRLFIVGRIKDLIIRSGFNVYPQEVETALCSHPDVVAAAVVGRSTAGNEEVVAFVQMRDGARATPEVLDRFVATKLAAYKRPSVIHLRSDLPMTSTGKINKAALRDEPAAAP